MNTQRFAKFIVANRISLAGVILIFIMAWKSEGFYHPDEHYQLLEYANYKSGLAIKEGLAWEFQYQIRPGLQPLVAYSALSIWRALGISNPFLQAFLLRLISGILSLILILKTFHYIRGIHPNQKTHQVFLFLVLFLWFAPFLQVRFSSENWSALSFFSGILLVLNYIGQTEKKKLGYLLLGGLALSLSFQFRYQIAFALLGFLAWLITFRKLDFHQWLYFSGAALVGLGIGLLADYWMYHTWQFTPYLYFHSNIIEGKAATFGTSPWWFYFTSLFKTLGPGLNVLLLGLFLIGVWRSLRHPFTWMLILFVIGHIVVDHKEMRFLFPMLIPFLYLVSSGWAGIPEGLKRPLWVKPIAIILLCINLLLLIYRLKEPAERLMPHYRFLYDRAKSGRDMLIFFYEPNSTFYTNSIYGPGNLRMTFYRPARLRQIPIHRPEEMDQFDISKTQNLVINFYPTLPPSRSKNQGLAFKNSQWLYSDLRKFQFFKSVDNPCKIFNLQPK